MTQAEMPALLLVDKPEGPTSHDAVRVARRVLGVRRIGHAGTLDPFASGLLLLCVGRATRLVQYFHLLSKWYRGTAVLGVETDTEDVTGAITATSEGWRDVSEADLRRVAGTMLGDQDQVPPAYSARKVDGRRAYEAARAGEEVALAPKAVTVHAMDISGWRPPELDFSAHVSTGTYVRSLARDLGRALSCGAHLKSLRRTSIGPFAVESAVTLDELDAGRIGEAATRTAAGAVEWLPTQRLRPTEIVEIEHGRRIAWPEDAHDPERPVALVAGERLVAIARVRGGELHPERVFHD